MFYHSACWRYRTHCTVFYTWGFAAPLCLIALGVLAHTNKKPNNLTGETEYFSQLLEERLIETFEAWEYLREQTLKAHGTSSKANICIGRLKHWSVAREEISHLGTMKHAGKQVLPHFQHPYGQVEVSERLMTCQISYRLVASGKK